MECLDCHNGRRIRSNFPRVALDHASPAANCGNASQHKEARDGAAASDLRDEAAAQQRHHDGLTATYGEAKQKPLPS
jgi:hypothetical protein